MHSANCNAGRGLQPWIPVYRSLICACNCMRMLKLARPAPARGAHVHRHAHARRAVYYINSINRRIAIVHAAILQSAFYCILTAIPPHLRKLASIVCRRNTGIAKTEELKWQGMRSAMLEDLGHYSVKAARSTSDMLAMLTFPCSVRMDSGWNCTPSSLRQPWGERL